MNALTAHAPDSVERAVSASPRRSPALVVNALALLAVAVVMRAWRLGNIPGVNGDEAWSGVWALSLLRGEVVDWWTPTGNPINAFFLLPLAALHTVFAPSVTLLRSVALASGVLALAVNYGLCRRAFDRRTAIVSTLLLALLPINVAYSRFAWDASQSLLATLLVLYLPLWHDRRNRGTRSLPVAAMIALAAAILVHPTNLFAAPLVIVPIAYGWRQAARQKLHQINVSAKPRMLVVLAAAAVALAYLGWQALAGTAGRLGPDDFAAFFENYLRLFSGATVYQYVSGVDAATGNLAAFAWLPAVCKLLFGLLAVFGAWGMTRRLVSEADDGDECLVIGWAVMLVAFFVVAGPDAIAPHLERYGICLVAPGAVVLSRGLAWWLEPGTAHARRAAWVLAIAAWLFPVTFYLGYFDFIERTGGRSHLTFRTAPVEPKAAALRYVIAHRDGHAPTRIVAGQWWNYWPLAYLSGGMDQVRVVSGQPWQPNGGVAGRANWEQTWYVEFADSPQEQDVLRALMRGEPNDAKTGRQVIRDYSGQALLSVIGPSEENFQNP